ncbi:MAG TPA: bifunctional nuclease family protein [Candidatus Obscuribacterales bacterium]
MMLEMHVAGLGVDVRNGQPILILNDDNQQRILPILIGPLECAAIALAVSKSKTERPLTHDLMLDVIAKTGLQVDHVEINEVDEFTYFAQIKLVRVSEGPGQLWGIGGDEQIALDARSSDAIAIALKTDAPILVSPKVVAEGSVAADLDKEMEERAAFRDFIKDVKASDFKNLGH